ncbi:MAG TPA: hypothetical protein VEA16_17520 [Vicinamibacterales bacterium]|nr:hypothetical protein [Vicinamibacterales bacterium]
MESNSADQEDRDDVLEEPRETGSNRRQQRHEERGAPAAGDNRRLGDADGNRTAGSAKTPGPPEADRDQS